MAKKVCAVCGKSLGMWSASSVTGDRQPICKDCADEANLYFGTHKHTLEEYFLHIEQLKASNSIYEKLFEPLTNKKEIREGSGFNQIFQKVEYDEKIKLYGSSLWTVDDYGLILFESSNKVKRGYAGRNLVFRYSELVSYSYFEDIANDDDCTHIDHIKLKFNSSYTMNEIEAVIPDYAVYQDFDNHFSGIVNGDKNQWNSLADNALAKVGL